MSRFALTAALHSFPDPGATVFVLCASWTGNDRRRAFLISLFPLTGQSHYISFDIWPVKERKIKKRKSLRSLRSLSSLCGHTRCGKPLTRGLAQRMSCEERTGSQATFCVQKTSGQCSSHSSPEELNDRSSGLLVRECEPCERRSLLRIRRFTVQRTRK